VPSGYLQDVMTALGFIPIISSVEIEFVLFLNFNGQYLNNFFAMVGKHCPRRGWAFSANHQHSMHFIF